MDLEVLNTNFERIAILDTYESLIWTDRYYKYGDFEIYTSASKEILEICKQDYYLVSPESDHVMFIESIKTETDVELGTHVTVTGRSLESMLTRRLVWNQTRITGNLQNGIKRLLNENVISPSIAERAIPNFIFEDTDDPVITEIGDLDLQYTGDMIYDVLSKLCEVYKIGWKITLNDDNQFIFKLYSGKDRSYDQDTLPYVVFSPNFDNLINSNYLESHVDYKTVGLVAGEGEGSARKTLVVGDNPGEGLARRELFVDARDISSSVNGGTLSPTEYNNNLKARGLERLAEHKITKTFEGQVEPMQMYQYGTDFFMGDITQLENEYGITSKVRVMEFIYSEESGGISKYPTFSVVEE